MTDRDPTPADARSRGDRPLRADARRNRERVLEAAESVFTTRGASASTEDVAREAAVGIGTVFRHFPTKEALLAEVFAAHLRRLVEFADTRASTEEPGSAFFAFFTHVVEGADTKLALADILAQAGVDVRGAAPRAVADLRAALGRLLERAQHARAVRADTGLAEVYTLLVGVSRASALDGGDVGARERALGIVFDGLRP